MGATGGLVISRIFTKKKAYANKEENGSKDRRLPLPMLDERAHNVSVHRQLPFSCLCIVALFFSLAAPAQAPPKPKAQPSPDVRVDINRSTVDELLKVPGMTRTWAARIVRFRPYRTKLDLLEHGVLSPEVYNRVKDCIIAHREQN
jgi:DNA uptake protein ComE-like DNA-binding protein